jgi:hypothetical protein
VPRTHDYFRRRNIRSGLLMTKIDGRTHEAAAAQIDQSLRWTPRRSRRSDTEKLS